MPIKDAASTRVIAQLPRVARHWSLEGFPAAAADRLRGVGLPERPRDTFRVTELSGNWPSRIGCIIAAVFLLAFVIGGLATILRWTPGIF